MYSACAAGPYNEYPIGVAVTRVSGMDSLQLLTTVIPVLPEDKARSVYCPACLPLAPFVLGGIRKGVGRFTLVGETGGFSASWSGCWHLPEVANPAR